jgi:hypothetical protein
MNTLSTYQALELVDIAANENRLYHHNGGQAYIRLSFDSQVLMIIDHTVPNPEITLCDGTKYFEDCKDYNLSHSARLREYGSLATWHITKYPQRVTN